MRAYHWGSALELARASGADVGDLEERTRFALRDAGDRTFALNSFPAAAAHYEAAIALWPEDDAGRPDLLFRQARALYRAYDEERRERALERARDAVLAAGTRDLAAEAEALLAHVAWERGQGELTRSRLTRALELAGESVTPSAARVYATSGRMRVIAGEREQGRQEAETALAIADELGPDELRAHARTTVGMAKCYGGDSSGIEDMERALALALEIGSPVASPIVNNLAVQAIIDGDLVRADELFREAARIAERFGDRGSVVFVWANRIWSGWMLGRWNAALEGAEDFIARCEAGFPHANEWHVRYIRGAIRAARGDLAGAARDHSQALALARETADPVHVVEALAHSAADAVERGDLVEARGNVAELIPLVRARPLNAALAVIAPHATRLGMAEDLRAAVEEAPGPKPERWLAAVRRSLDGDLRGTADLFAAIGSPTWEARTRLLAGEQLLEEGRREEGEAEVRRALAFYESVGATRYVAWARALLGKGAYSAST